jgi:hypothetical protein
MAPTIQLTITITITMTMEIMTIIKILQRLMRVIKLTNHSLEKMRKERARRVIRVRRKMRLRKRLRKRKERRIIRVCEWRTCSASRASNSTKVMTTLVKVCPLTPLSWNRKIRGLSTSGTSQSLIAFRLWAARLCGELRFSALGTDFRNYGILMTGVRSRSVRTFIHFILARNIKNTMAVQEIS